MRDFLKMMRQYVSPYKAYMGGAVVLNILSVVFNIFSFAILVPLLNILFKVDTTQYQFIPWGSEAYSFKDTLMNNFYFYVSQHIAQHGAMNTLLLLGAIMIGFTALKTACYFGSNAVMVPISNSSVLLSVLNDRFFCDSS